MGLSSNQARFLALTSRQVDLEHRIQQICQRRLRLTSELENVATSYNNQISNRRMFTPTNAGIQRLSMDGLKQLDYKVINAVTKAEAAKSMKPITQISESAATAANYVVIKTAADFVNSLNGGAATAGKTYILEDDINLSELGPLTNSVITNTFQGNFNGNGYVINNLNINSSGTGPVGLFSAIDGGGTIQNVAIEGVSINAANATQVGALAGNASNCTIKNSYAVGDSILGNTQVGGLVGGAGNITIQDSFATSNISSNYAVGGLVGAIAAGNISTSYATGNVTNLNGAAGGTYHGCDTGGLVGNSANLDVTNCYSEGTVVGVLSNTGGLVGYHKGGAITNSYSASPVNGSGIVGGQNSGGTDDATNFYLAANAGGDTGGATTNQAAATAGWNTSIWDKSGALPKLISTGSIPSDRLEEGLRNGVYSLAKPADEYSQDPIDLEGGKYQEVDWRSTPEIYDELNNGDDVDAENKYDKTVEEINAQDKKLQLEQTSIEVEYKAITSERESVKKILDTNAQSSFKYFS